MQMNLSLGDDITIPQPPSKKLPKGKLLSILPENYCIIDIETTGLSAGFDEIIELSAIKVRKNDAKETFSTLVSPKRGVSNFIRNLTGISLDMLKNQPDIKTALKNFREFLGDDIVIGHNVKFDVGFIQCETKVHFDENFHNNFVDTLFLARKTYDLANYKLSTIAKHLNIDTKGAHRGLKDCEITYVVYCDIKKNYKFSGML